MSGLDKNTNSFAGEATISLGGATQRLRLDVGQIEELEKELGLGAVQIYMALMLQKYTVGQLRVILAESLKKSPEHPRPDKDLIWRWLMDSQDLTNVAMQVGEFWGAALGFKQKGEKSENPPEADGENS